MFGINPDAERARIGEIRALRANRDAAAWQNSIAELESAARGSENLMPRILAAAEADATVGEISDTLRRVFGEYRDTL